MQFSTYSFILAISVILSLGGAYYTWKRRASADSLYLFFVIASAGIWSFFGLLASMATIVEAKIFYSQWQYFGISTVAVFFFLFTLKFTNKLPRLEPIHYLALFSIPILTVFAAFTNDIHHLLWREVSLTQTPFTLVTGYYVPGVVFWIALAYNYLMVALSITILVNESIKYPQHYLAQVLIIIISISLPLIGNIVYSFRRADVKGVDFTSVAITIGSLLLLLGLSRYKLLNVKPLARDFLFNSMLDGVIFLDAFDRIIDINKSAQVTFGIDNQRLSVRRLESIRCANREIEYICRLQANSRTEVNFPQGSSSYFDVSVHPLFDPRGNGVGRVIIMHDISELKLSQLTIRKQNQELELLNQQKDRMFSIVSHDLKSPLASIVSVAEMLSENSFRFTEAEKERIVGNFLARARITLEMIENVLQWARLQNYGLSEELH
jgi:PAS domain S-box-containing protein